MRLALQFVLNTSHPSGVLLLSQKLFVNDDRAERLEMTRVSRKLPRPVYLVKSWKEAGCSTVTQLLPTSPRLLAGLEHAIGIGRAGYSSLFQQAEVTTRRESQQEQSLS